MVGKFVILTLGLIDSTSFNSNFGTSVEMDLIWTNFHDFLSKGVGKIVILTLGAIDSAHFNSNFGTSVEMDPILTD